MHAGPIHFLQYDSETPFVPGSLQYEWILNDLASVDRTKTPWVSGMPCCPAVHAVKLKFQGCSAPELRTVQGIELHCHCVANQDAEVHTMQPPKALTISSASHLKGAGKIYRGAHLVHTCCNGL